MSGTPPSPIPGSDGALRYFGFQVDLLLIHGGASIGSLHQTNIWRTDMSILDSLNLSEVSKKSESATPLMAQRRKMIVALDEQIAGAQAELQGQHYVRNVVKKVVNAETGLKHRINAERPLRKFWWKSSSGILLELRFAGRPLLLANKPSVVVGDPSNLVPILEQVRAAVAAGELDDALRAAAEGRKRPGKKTGRPVGNGPQVQPITADHTSTPQAKSVVKSMK